MANEKVTGTVIVRVDGKSIKSKEGASIELGGFERTPVFADGILIGYSEKPTACIIVATLAHTSSSDLIGIREMVDVSGVFETDSGTRYSVRGMFNTKPPKLTGGEGDVAVEFAGSPAQ